MIDKTVCLFTFASDNICLFSFSSSSSSLLFCDKIISSVSYFLSGCLPFIINILFINKLIQFLFFFFFFFFYFATFFWYFFLPVFKKIISRIKLSVYMLFCRSSMVQKKLKSSYWFHCHALDFIRIELSSSSYKTKKIKLWLLLLLVVFSAHRS